MPRPIRRLTEAQRASIRDAVEDGIPIEEIASEFGISPAEARKIAPPTKSDPKRGKKVNLKKLVTTPPKPRRYVIEPLVKQGSSSALAGEPKAGKSLLALALGIGVTDGADVGPFAIENPGKVLYIDAENNPDPDDDIHERVYKLTLEHPERFEYRDMRGTGFSVAKDLDVLA